MRNTHECNHHDERSCWPRSCGQGPGAAIVRIALVRIAPVSCFTHEAQEQRRRISGSRRKRESQRREDDDEDEKDDADDAERGPSDDDDQQPHVRAQQKKHTPRQQDGAASGGAPLHVSGGDRRLRCSLARDGRTWAASLDGPEPAARLEELMSSRQSALRKLLRLWRGPRSLL